MLCSISFLMWLPTYTVFAKHIPRHFIIVFSALNEISNPIKVSN